MGTHGEDLKINEESVQLNCPMPDWVKGRWRKNSSQHWSNLELIGQPGRVRSTHQKPHQSQTYTFRIRHRGYYQRVAVHGMHPTRIGVQQRVTSSLVRQEGGSIHIRKAITAEPELKKIYQALGIHPAPGGVKRMVS